MTERVVLLVDDNEDCRIIYGSTLRHAGYAVKLANDGMQAIESVSTTAPDLILLDISMPRMDGLETLENLKRDPRTSAIPVVAVSARVGKDQQADVLKAGFSEVLLKPVTPAEILSSVKRHLPLE
jgi:putative two-component system response regulator